MDGFSLWLGSGEVAAQGLLQLYFMGRFTGAKPKAGHFVLYLVLLYGCQAAAAALGLNLAAVFGELAALYAMGRAALKNSRPAACVASILAVYVTQLSFGVVSSLDFLVLRYALGWDLLMKIFIALASLLAAALCFCCYQQILKRFSLRGGMEQPYIWMLLPPSLFFFAVELVILYVIYGRVVTFPAPPEVGKHLGMLALQLLGLFALFSSLYVYQRTKDGFEARAALASLTQEVRAQKNYVAEARLRYARTRAFRHDVKNHLYVLDGLLKAGQAERAQRYLQGLTTVADALSPAARTGNPVVDILLEEKLALAKADGAAVDISLALPQPCTVDDLDLCVIFANALDNALRACTQADGAKFIRVRGERQGDFYMVEFENSCLPEPRLTFGTGLANMKAVAEKYGGAMAAEQSRRVFRLNVLLNISIPPDDSSRQNG